MHVAEHLPQRRRTGAHGPSPACLPPRPEAPPATRSVARCSMRASALAQCGRSASLSGRATERNMHSAGSPTLRCCATPAGAAGRVRRAHTRRRPDHAGACQHERCNGRRRRRVLAQAHHLRARRHAQDDLAQGDVRRAVADNGRRGEEQAVRRWQRQRHFELRGGGHNRRAWSRFAPVARALSSRAAAFLEPLPSVLRGRWGARSSWPRRLMPTRSARRSAHAARAVVAPPELRAGVPARLNLCAWPSQSARSSITLCTPPRLGRARQLTGIGAPY